MNTLYLVRPQGPGRNFDSFKWRVICAPSGLEAARACVAFRKTMPDTETRPTYEVVPAIQICGILATYESGMSDSYVPQASSSFSNLWDWPKLQLINM